MLTKSQYELLLDYDSGSCRDITFSYLSIEQAKRAIEWLAEAYEKHEVTTVTEENRIDTIDLIAFFQKGYQNMFCTAKSDFQTIAQVQFYLANNFDSTYFLELSFFPENIMQGSDSVSAINNWLNRMDEKIRPDSFYLRYENASWVFGDESKNSGVILSKIRTLAP